jgi:hypothetical protein
MRASDRQAFLQEIEEAEYEQQELARLEAEEQAEQERQANELRSIATTILSHFDLERYADRFLASPDGLALLANCCNCAAKFYDCDLYEYKPTLINLATESGIECWQADGIVYIETPIVQVSFHALYSEDEGLPEANGRVWNELECQFNAGIVANAWLHDWSRYALKQILALKSSAAEEIAA